MEPMTLPRLYLDENNVVPIILRKSNDEPVTGLPYNQVTVEYSRKTDALLNSFVPGVTQWDERGRGFYALTIPGSISNVIGMFELYVAPPEASGVPFMGISEIDKRVEIRVLEAPVTGYTSPSVGKALEDSVEYRVRVSPQYDYVNSTVDFVIWLERQGQVVTNPTSCGIKMIRKEASGDTTIVDATNSSPDVNGNFYIRKTGTVLNANKNYSLVARVTYDGVTYTSGNGGQTLN